MISDDELRLLQAMSVDQLLEELGTALPRKGLGAAPSKRRMIDQAREWLAENNDLLKRKLCSNDDFRRFCKSTEKNEFKLLQLAIDTVSAMYIHLPAATIITLLTKLAEGNFCGGIDAV